MPVNFSNADFQTFVSFAQARVADNDAKAVIDARPGNGLDGHKITISQSETDSVHKWMRDLDEKTVNNRTRDLFKSAVADLFGGEDKIPATVKKAMLLVDYNQGKPLTARRILAVRAAVDPFVAKFNETLAAAKAGVVLAYGRVGAGQTQADVDGLVETAMRAVGTDSDALDILAGREVMDSLLVNGASNLRSPDDIEKKVKAILANLDELRQVAGGNRAVIAAGKRFIMQLGGKAVPKGMISAIVRGALAADVSAIKRLSATSSGHSIHKAVSQFVTTQVRLADTTGVDKATVAPDEKAAARDFIGLLLLAKCGTSGIRKIQAAMHSENAQKLHSVYTLIYERDFVTTGLSSGAVNQTSIMGVRWRNHLEQLKISTDALMGVPDNQLMATDDFGAEFDYNDFGAPRIVSDLIDAGKAEGRRTHDEFLEKAVNGNSPGANALRKVYENLIGMEAHGPEEKIDGTSRSNVTAMINWTIASECRKIANGGLKNTTFALDVGRMKGSLKVGDVVLSGDLDTACDQIAAFVTKGAKNTYAALTDAEKGKAHVVMALLSQDTGKAAYNGQFQSLDPKNAALPVVTTSDQEADERSISLEIDRKGNLKMQFDGVQHLQIIMTDPGDGKSVTTIVGEGSNVEAHLLLTIDAQEFDRLGNLDYSEFDDTEANRIMAEKDGEDRLPRTQQSLGDNFRFNQMGIGLKVGLKATIN